MASGDIEDLTRAVVKFRDERNWAQFHNPKDLAISLSLEASELLELVQWKNGEELSEHLSTNKKQVGQELSDILYWTLLIAHELRIDLVEAFAEKMAINEQKYPAPKVQGSSRKYTDYPSNL